jgi:hypothetical protein
MKLHKISLALLLGIGMFTSCSSKLDVENPNQQNIDTFGNTAEDLEESVIAAYNHLRMEGSFARVGYMIDVCRGDECWNSSQVWYMPFDDFTVPVTMDIPEWPWREYYYTINVCNFILERTDTDGVKMTEAMKYIKGQAHFIRGLAYYNLAVYYQNPPLIVHYDANATLNDLYAGNSTYDEVLDQVEKDFSTAMTLLPTRDLGDQWAQGRATCGSAAGFYARVLMQRHKFAEALVVLKDILNTSDGGNKKYGTYRLMENYGDNFREGSAYENNAESLFEIQFLDYGSQGTEEEWTPVNTTPNATQGSAIESNFGPGDFGGWADISASNWLYDLFKAEKTVEGKLDPRLYWTIGTYEDDWDDFEYGNKCYTTKLAATDYIVTNNNNGGLPVAKHTNLRTGLYSKIVVGLRDGINLRLMRYSDVLLRAAECENEVNGPTQQAIDWINAVRERANLEDLKLSDFAGNADKLFEQIANVERPKEFGCEYGRGFDLLRWGFFYDEGRLQQMKEHATFLRTNIKSEVKNSVSYADKAKDSRIKSSFDTYSPGHEFLPIVQSITSQNPNLDGNSANYSTDNSEYFKSKGWTVRPVTVLQ